MRPMPIEQTSPLGPWPEGILPVHCSECRLPLCISMPREEFPKRLVGTCVGCWVKYDIAWTADGTEALIGRLPDERTTRPISALPDATEPLRISGCPVVPHPLRWAT